MAFVASQRADFQGFFFVFKREFLKSAANRASTTWTFLTFVVESVKMNFA